MWSDQSNMKLLFLLIFLSTVDCIRDCYSNEECILASSCAQYTEDSGSIALLSSSSVKYRRTAEKLDAQICEESWNQEEKVCCKKDEDFMRFKINNGTTVDVDTARRKYPWMARLVFDGDQFCGGVVIDSRYVLTARHCVEACPCFIRMQDWSFCRLDCTVKLRVYNSFQITDDENLIGIEDVFFPGSSLKHVTRRQAQRLDLALVKLGEERRKR